MPGQERVSVNMTQRTAPRSCVAVGIFSLRVLFPYAVCVILLATAVSSVSAQVVITEIMYDPPARKDAGYEWIEIMNDGESTVDMTAYRLSEGKTLHYIKEGMSGNREMAPGDIAVIVQDEDVFRVEYPAYTKHVFLSKFSLRQQSGIGEPLGIHDTATKKTVSYFHYTPDSRADGTGASLHIADGEQVAAPATPGDIMINPITMTNGEECPESGESDAECGEVGEEVPEEIPEEVTEEKSVEEIVTELLRKKTVNIAAAPPKAAPRNVAPTATVEDTPKPLREPMPPAPVRETNPDLPTVKMLLLWIAVAFTILVLEVLYLCIILGRRTRRGNEEG